MRATIILLVVGGLVLAHLPVAAQSLRGSQASMDRQNRVAREHDFTYLRTAAQVREFVRAGYLVAVPESRDLKLHNVSFPVARPEARLFLERLAQQYHRACGEPLVVTSLTRPLSHQPRNASARSVHPTGMAIDLRRSSNARCRRWLEGVLLSLEDGRIIEAVRENNPPHYHVAVFPRQYRQYVERLTGQTVRLAGGGADRHMVRRGDTLWVLARQYGTSVDAIRQANSLRSDRIYAGQELAIPTGR